MDWVSVDGIIGAVGGVLVAAGTVFLAPYRWLQNEVDAARKTLDRAGATPSQPGRHD